MGFKNQRVAGGTLSVSANFRQVMKNTLQAVALLFIGVFSFVSMFATFYLNSWCNDLALASQKLLFFCVFVLLLNVFIIAIWDVAIPKIAGKCKLVMLEFVIYSLFVVLGGVTFFTFMYQSLVFWWGDLISLRFLPLVFGALFFIRFCVKVLFD